MEGMGGGGGRGRHRERRGRELSSGVCGHASPENFESNFWFTYKGLIV